MNHLTYIATGSLGGVTSAIAARLFAFFFQAEHPSKVEWSALSFGFVVLVASWSAILAFWDSRMRNRINEAIRPLQSDVHQIGERVAKLEGAKR